MASEATPREMQRLQAVLTLFALVWEVGMAWQDYVEGETIFALIEFGSGMVCVGLAWLIYRGRMRLDRLGYIALALASATFLVLLLDVAQYRRQLSSYCYMDATIISGLAYAFLEIPVANLLTLLVNVLLLAVSTMSGQVDISLVGGQMFISGLLAYVAMHNRYVQNVLRHASRADSEIAEMTTRDHVTGLTSLSGLQVYLRQM